MILTEQQAHDAVLRLCGQTPPGPYTATVAHNLNNAGQRGSSFPPVVRALAGPLFFLGEGIR